jgi:hypothetical protein
MDNGELNGSSVMRRFLCASLLAITAGLAGAAPQRVTVDQLRQAIQSRLAAHDGDETLARYLASLELSERLTQTSLRAILAEHPQGPKTTVSLELLAAASTFLAPPSSERPAQSAPDATAQQAILNSAVRYVADTFKRLPNFLATRTTRSFDDTPLVVTHSGWAPSNSELHLASTFEQEVTYRNGREDALRSKATSGANTRQGGSPPGLSSTGEFGPILVIILRDASKGKIAWDRWETSESGPLAVFRFEVPAPSSHYEVNFCCVRGSEDPGSYGSGGLGSAGSPDPDNAYRGTPAYHGTLTIDPKTGTISEITVEPDLKTDGPISRSSIAVEYGPVEIGGASYVCPVRSIAVSKSKTRLGGDMSDRTVLRINEVTFTDYHRFGSTSRIVHDSGL